jgi:hypothetical protein
MRQQMKQCFECGGTKNNWTKMFPDCVCDPPELSKESLEDAIIAINVMVADMEEEEAINKKPTKIIIQPALLAQRGYTVEDVFKMVREQTT